jgi:hypothetical protein
VTGSASQFPVQAQCRLEAVWITIDIAIIPPARDTLAQGVGSGSHLVCRRGMQRHKKKHGTRRVSRFLSRGTAGWLGQVKRPPQTDQGVLQVVSVDHTGDRRY